MSTTSDRLTCASITRNFCSTGGYTTFTAGRMGWSLAEGEVVVDPRDAIF